MDGMYKNVGKMPMNQLPRRCNSPCVYEKKGGMDGMQYCFADSFSSQSMCDSMDVGSTGGPDDGETPVDMGSSSGSKEETTNMGGMGETTMGMGGKTTGMGGNEGKETTKEPSSGMVSPGDKETTTGMGDHGGKETTKGMEGHGGQETTKGMSDNGGDMGMGDHGGKETTKGMSDHGGDMGMG